MQFAYTCCARETCVNSVRRLHSNGPSTSGVLVNAFIPYVTTNRPFESMIRRHARHPPPLIYSIHDFLSSHRDHAPPCRDPNIMKTWLAPSSTVHLPCIAGAMVYCVYSISSTIHVPRRTLHIPLLCGGDSVQTSEIPAPYTTPHTPKPKPLHCGGDHRVVASIPVRAPALRGRWCTQKRGRAVRAHAPTMRG